MSDPSSTQQATNVADVAMSVVGTLLLFIAVVILTMLTAVEVMCKATIRHDRSVNKHLLKIF